MPLVSKIIADVRESGFVVHALREMKADVVEKTISPGDYVVGERFAVERKTFRDFELNFQEALVRAAGPTPPSIRTLLSNR